MNKKDQVIEILKVTLYRGSPIYIRRVGRYMFEYLVIFENKIYASHAYVTPPEKRKNLTKNEVEQSAGVIFLAATSTVDTLLGGGKVDEAIKKAEKELAEVEKQIKNSETIN